MDERYCLAFDGRVANGFAVEQVRANLASLLHLEERQIERLFGGTPVVVKRDLDKAQAIKYRNMLAKTGALLLIRPEAGAAPAVAESAPETAVPAPAVETTTAPIAPAKVESPVAPVGDAPVAPAAKQIASGAAIDTLDCPRCGHSQPCAEQCEVCKVDLRLHLRRLEKRARVRAALR